MESTIHVENELNNSNINRDVFPEIHVDNEPESENHSVDDSGEQSRIEEIAENEESDPQQATPPRSPSPQNSPSLPTSPSPQNSPPRSASPQPSTQIETPDKVNTPEETPNVDATQSESWQDVSHEAMFEVSGDPKKSLFFDQSQVNGDEDEEQDTNSVPRRRGESVSQVLKRLEPATPSPQKTHSRKVSFEEDASSDEEDGIVISDKPQAKAQQHHVKSRRQTPVPDKISVIDEPTKKATSIQIWGTTDEVKKEANQLNNGVQPNYQQPSSVSPTNSSSSDSLISAIQNMMSKMEQLTKENQELRSLINKSEPSPAFTPSSGVVVHHHHYYCATTPRV
jgi:hypothetical protein